MVYDDERMLVVSILPSPLPYFHLFLFFFALAAGRKALWLENLPVYKGVAK